MLKLPNWVLFFYIYCNASSIAVDSTFYQLTKDRYKDYLIGFFSKKLNTTIQNYNITETKCLTLVFFMKKF